MARITVSATSAACAANQGVARDATRFWTCAGPDNLTLVAWSVNGSGLPDVAGGELEHRDCTGDAPLSIQQINGLFFHTVDSMLYVTCNNFGSLNHCFVLVYDPDNLAGGPIATHALRDFAAEVVTWDPVRLRWWAFYHATTDIDEYDTSWNLLRTYSLNVIPDGVGTNFWNGGFWVDDCVYLNPHNSNTDNRIFIYKFAGGGFTFINRVPQPSVNSGQGLFLYDANTLYAAERSTTFDGAILKCAFVKEPVPTSLVSKLVEWYEFNEMSGDAIGAKAAKTLTETSGTIDAGSGPGTSGARDFERGDTEYFGRTDAAFVLSGNQDITIVAFLKAETLPGANMGLVSHYNSGITQAGYLLYIGGGSNKLQFAVSPDGTGTAGNAKEAIIATTVSLATWYFVCGEHDAAADTIRIHANSLQTTMPVVTTGYTGGVFASTAEFEIGGFAAGANNFDGLMAKVGIFNAVLNDAEKEWLNNSGNGRTYSEIAAAGIITESRAAIGGLMMLGVGRDALPLPLLALTAAERWLRARKNKVRPQ